MAFDPCEAEHQTFPDAAAGQTQLSLRERLLIIRGAKGLLADGPPSR